MTPKKFSDVYIAPEYARRKAHQSRMRRQWNMAVVAAVCLCVASIVLYPSVGLTDLIAVAGGAFVAPLALTAFLRKNKQ